MHAVPSTCTAAEPLELRNENGENRFTTSADPQSGHAGAMSASAATRSS
jgi:hypothetical protein